MKLYVDNRSWFEQALDSFQNEALAAVKTIIMAILVVLLAVILIVVITKIARAIRKKRK